MEIRQIGVVGAGPLGAGIAQACVQSGLEVLLVDDTEQVLGYAEDMVLRGLHRAEQPAAFGLLRKATRLDKLEPCDLVIECASEAPEAKQDLLRRIDARVERSCVLAVQTTALPVSVVARAVENPERVVGLQFFHPPHITKLVELIRYEHASEAALGVAAELAARLGKTAVVCADRPGFVVNRVARAFYLTAMRLLEGGRGTPAAIDAALRARGGFRAGPFEILDFFGLEEDFAVSEIVYQLLGRPERLKPPAIEQALIVRGCRGRRNSRGFYVYGENPPGTENPLVAELAAGYNGSPEAAPAILRTVLEAVFAEAHAVVDEGIARAADVDVAMRLGLYWPKGPFEWEKELSR
ncbi:MAG: 3-hydroxyacyl-CoA dehydrogenase NAD-binding domain-containing protein [Elusimicrobiota bacterium]